LEFYFFNLIELEFYFRVDIIFTAGFSWCKMKVCEGWSQWMKTSNWSALSIQIR